MKNGMGCGVLAVIAVAVLASCGGRDGAEEPAAGAAATETHAGQNNVEYVCPPCGCQQDNESHDTPGPCTVCGMAMVDKAGVLSVDAIPQFRRVNDSVWTSGQPTLDQFVKLKAAGVATVINLRVPSEHSGEIEGALVRELGMKYINIPVDLNNPKATDVTEFLTVTDRELSKGLVLIHCTAAIRVGSFWMIRRILRDGWETAAALEEANNIGLQNHRTWLAFAKRMIDESDRGAQ